MGETHLRHGSRDRGVPVSAVGWCAVVVWGGVARLSGLAIGNVEGPISSHAVVLL